MTQRWHSWHLFTVDVFSWWCHQQTPCHLQASLLDRLCLLDQRGEPKKHVWPYKEHCKQQQFKKDKRPDASEYFHRGNSSSSCDNEDVNPHGRGDHPNLNKLDDHHSKPDSIESDRKSTRLNSSHVAISYAVFCLKKKR